MEDARGQQSIRFGLETKKMWPLLVLRASESWAIVGIFDERLGTRIALLTRSQLQKANDLEKRRIKGPNANQGKSPKTTLCRIREKGRSRKRDDTRSLESRTKSSLYEQTKKMGIEGRSKMDKMELARAQEKVAKALGNRVIRLYGFKETKRHGCEAKRYPNRFSPLS